MSSVGAEQHDEAAAHERLVVGDGDADHDRLLVGQPGRDPEPAAGLRARLERAAVHRDPLAHADQAVAAAALGAAVDAPAVVGDLEAERTRLVAHDAPSPCAGPGVLQHVGERLLHDPVRGEVDAARQLHPRRRRTTTSTGTPGAVELADEPVELGEPGRGRVRGRAALGLVGLAQHAEHAADLGQRRAADARDRLERALRLLRVRVDDVLAPPTPAPRSRPSSARPRRAARGRCAGARRRRPGAPPPPSRAPARRPAPRARRSAAFAVLEVEPEHEHRREQRAVQREARRRRSRAVVGEQQHEQADEDHGRRDRHLRGSCRSRRR